MSRLKAFVGGRSSWRVTGLCALAMLSVSCGDGVLYRNYQYLRDDRLGTVPANAIALENRPGVVYWHGDRSKPRIALTFDDGPSQYTPQILAVLAEYRVKATFFMIGKNVEHAPDIARSVVAHGHAIGNHTYNHPYLVRETESNVIRELTRGERAIIEATSLRPAMFRPPFGAADHYTFDAGHRAGYVAIEWSGASKDWLTPGADVIVKHVLAHAKNGAIILMHDGGGDRSQTVAAIKRIIPELQRQGFELVTVPTLLDIPTYALAPTALDSRPRR